MSNHACVTALNVLLKCADTVCRHAENGGYNAYTWQGSPEEKMLTDLSTAVQDYRHEVLSLAFCHQAADLTILATGTAQSSDDRKFDALVGVTQELRVHKNVLIRVLSRHPEDLMMAFPDGEYSTAKEAIDALIAHPGEWIVNGVLSVANAPVEVNHA